MVMGPILFKKQKGETLYSIRLLPIGGACRFEGEDDIDGEEKNYDGTINLVFPIIAVNNGDKNIIGSIREFSINGWEVETYNSIEIDAGKKVKDEFKLKDVYGKTDITSIDKITEIEFYGSTTDPSNNKYITKDLRKTIVFQ